MGIRINSIAQKLGHWPHHLFTAPFLALQHLAQAATPPLRLMLRLRYVDEAAKLALKLAVANVPPGRSVFNEYIEVLFAHATIGYTLRSAETIPRLPVHQNDALIFNCYAENRDYERDFDDLDEVRDWLQAEILGKKPAVKHHEGNTNSLLIDGPMTYVQQHVVRVVDSDDDDATAALAASAVGRLQTR